MTTEGERMEALAVREEQAIVPQEQSPVAWAIANNVSPEQMLQYYKLDREIKADQAKMAYNAAMNEFKSNLPRITKNKHVRFETSKGVTEYDHATHDHVVDILVPALAAVGIRHHWVPTQGDGMMTVTCVLTHTLGHSESASLTAAYDQSGGKNAIQAVVSAKSYLERHTLLAISGQTTKDIDDDGKGAGQVQQPSMPDEEFRDWVAKIANEPVLKRAQNIFSHAYVAAKNTYKDETAMQSLQEHWEARKELGDR